MTVCARTHRPPERIEASEHYHVFLPIPPDESPVMCVLAATVYEDVVHPVRRAEVRCDCGIAVCRICVADIHASRSGQAQEPVSASTDD